MRPRPSVVSLALVTLALVHAAWGVRMLAASAIALAASQLVFAGALLLAAAGARSRSTFATALWLAAGATLVRLLANLGAPSPWTAPSATLVLGVALAAWGAARTDAGNAYAPLAQRGGFLAMAASYGGFLVLSFLFGGSVVDRVDLSVRVAAAVAVAVFLDAPAVVLRRRPLSASPDVAAP